MIYCRLWKYLELEVNKAHECLQLCSLFVEKFEIGLKPFLYPPAFILKLIENGRLSIKFDFAACLQVESYFAMASQLLGMTRGKDYRILLQWTIWASWSFFIYYFTNWHVDIDYLSHTYLKYARFQVLSLLVVQFSFHNNTNRTKHKMKLWSNSSEDFSHDLLFLF